MIKKAYESVKSFCERGKTAIADFVTRTSPIYQGLQKSNSELSQQLDEQRRTNQDLESRARTAENAHQILATGYDALEQAFQESESEAAALKADKNPYSVSQLTQLIRHTKADLRNSRRENKKLQAEQRRSIHYSVCQHLEQSQDRGAVIAVNHAGFVTYQSEKSEKIYGPLIGKNAKSIISGSSEEVRKTYDHFNKPTEGWLYTKTKGQPKPTKVKVTPLKDSSDKIHTTLIKIESMGNVPKAWDAITGGESCFQTRLREDAKKIQEQEQQRQERLARTDAIAEQVRKGIFNPGL